MKHVAMGAVGAGAVVMAVAVPAVWGAFASPANQPTSVASATQGIVVSGPAASAAGTDDPAATKRSIIRAVTQSEELADLPSVAYEVGSVTVSRADRAWARAIIEPRATDAFDRADVVLRRQGDTWSVADLGTIDVGCGIAPRNVLRDLKLECTTV